MAFYVTTWVDHSTFWLNELKLTSLIVLSGLGKTLQTLCAIASSYASSNSHSLPPSLIIAPNTVVTHWVNEVERFFAETEVLKPFALIGSKMSRNQLQEVLSGISSYNIIVMSYECARKEIRLIQEGRWHYCVLGRLFTYLIYLKILQTSWH